MSLQAGAGADSSCAFACHPALCASANVSSRQVGQALLVLPCFVRLLQQRSGLLSAPLLLVSALSWRQPVDLFRFCFYQLKHATHFCASCSKADDACLGMNMSKARGVAQSERV